MSAGGRISAAACAALALAGCARGGGSDDLPRMKDGYWAETWVFEGHTHQSAECLRDHTPFPLVFPRCDTHEFTRVSPTLIRFHMICTFGEGMRHASETRGTVSGDLDTAFQSDQTDASGGGLSHHEFRYLGPQCPPGG